MISPYAYNQKKNLKKKHQKKIEVCDKLRKNKVFLYLFKKRETTQKKRDGRKLVTQRNAIQQVL